MSNQPKRSKWLAHLMAAAMTFGVVGFGPDVVEVVTQTTDTVEAQYAQARRVSRRTSRRTSRRHDYYYNFLHTLPVSATMVDRGGKAYEEADGNAGLAVVVLGSQLVTAHVVGAANVNEPPYKSAKRERMDPKAEQVLRDMADRLESAEQFTIQGRRTSDPVLNAGANEAVTSEVTVAVKRPNKLYGEVRSEGDHRKLFYDGEDFTIVDLEEGEYATISAPGTIDELVRMLGEEYGVYPPIGDLIASDPFAHLTRYIEAGKYLGQEQVDGKTTDHVRFEEEYLTWELWVDAEEKLPVKTAVSIPHMQDNPKLVAEGIEFDTQPDLNEEMFTFDQQRDFEEVPMEPRDRQPGATK